MTSRPLSAFRPARHRSRWAALLRRLSILTPAKFNDVPFHWRSIPLRFSTNQRYWWDEQGQRSDCCELWIGGTGSRKAILTIPCVASSTFDAPDERWSPAISAATARWHNRVRSSTSSQSRDIASSWANERSASWRVKWATVLAIGEKKRLAAYAVPRARLCVTDHRTWHCRRRTRLRERPMRHLPDISATGRFLQHRLLKLKLATAGADPS